MVLYEPVDVSASALDGAKQRIEREIAGVTVAPRAMDYTDGDGSRFDLGAADGGERRLVLYIGSSIGNFEPHQAARLLGRVRAGLETGDGLLLGVDLVKDEATLRGRVRRCGRRDGGVQSEYSSAPQPRAGRGLRCGGLRAPRGVECARVADGDAPGEPNRPAGERRRAGFDG